MIINNFNVWQLAYHIYYIHHHHPSATSHRPRPPHPPRECPNAPSSFPLFSFFISNGGSTCCPRFFSFHFERGQHSLPPCLFISFRTGAAFAAPVSFRFVLNGGSTCCPHFFPFRTGAACNQHATAVSFVYHPYLFPAASTNGAA